MWPNTRTHTLYSDMALALVALTGNTVERVLVVFLGTGRHLFLVLVRHSLRGWTSWNVSLLVYVPMERIEKNKATPRDTPKTVPRSTFIPVPGGDMFLRGPCSP